MSKLDWDSLPLEIQFHIMGLTGSIPSFDYDYSCRKKLQVLSDNYQNYICNKYVCCVCMEWTSRPGKMYYQYLHTGKNPNCPHAINGSRICNDCFETIKSEDKTVRCKDITLDDDYDHNYIKNHGAPNICGSPRDYVSKYGICHDCLGRFPKTELTKYYIFYDTESKKLVYRKDEISLEDERFYIYLFILDALRCKNCLTYKPSRFL